MRAARWALHPSVLCAQIFPYMFPINISANQFPLSLKSTTCCSGVSWSRYMFFFSAGHFLLVHLIPKPLRDPKSSFFNGSPRVRDLSTRLFLIDRKKENVYDTLISFFLEEGFGFILTPSWRRYNRRARGWVMLFIYYLILIWPSCCCLLWHSSYLGCLMSLCPSLVKRSHMHLRIHLTKSCRNGLT